MTHIYKVLETFSDVQNFYCINNVLVVASWKFQSQWLWLIIPNKIQMPACQGAFLETMGWIHNAYSFCQPEENSCLSQSKELYVPDLKKSCNSCQKLAYFFCGKRSCIRLWIPSWATGGAKTFLGDSVVISVQSADCGHTTEVLEANFYSVFFWWTFLIPLCLWLIHRTRCAENVSYFFTLWGRFHN